MALLEVAGLKKSFGGLQAVQGFDFSMKEGEIVSLIGPNGSGKTTIFNLITGMLRRHRRPGHLPRPAPAARVASPTPSPRSASRAPSRTSVCSTR